MGEGRPGNGAWQPHLVAHTGGKQVGRGVEGAVSP